MQKLVTSPFIRSFWKSGNLFSKSGRRPQPMKGLGSLSSTRLTKKFVFSANLHEVFAKKFLAAGGKLWKM